MEEVEKTVVVVEYTYDEHGNELTRTTTTTKYQHNPNTGGAT